MKDLFSIGSVGSTFVLARKLGLLPQWLFAGRMASLRSCLMRLLILMRMPRSYKQEVGEEPSGFLCARGQLVVVGRKGQAALRRGEPSCAGSRWRRRSVMTTGLRTRGSVSWMSGRILTQSCDWILCVSHEVLFPRPRLGMWTVFPVKTKGLMFPFVT